MNSPLVLSTLAILLAASNCACAGDWMTWRSTYTHDPATGQRVEQYAVPVEPLALLVAVEMLPDIMRTLGNVTMDVAVTATVDRSSANSD